MTVSSSPKVVIVGARSARQGTGPFIAAGLSAAGARIGGIVGTSEASINAALNGLKHDWGIETVGHSSLSAALSAIQPDAVAICSPWRFHADQLREVAEANCHCLVEKPLAWPASIEEVDSLIAEYENRGLLLDLVGQWPATLSAFSALHSSIPESIDTFRMRLSPISIGEDMIADAAPHFISMLQALAGPGDCLASTAERDADNTKLTLTCTYKHGGGSLSAQLLLETCNERPRPAWYEVNDLRVDRSVRLPQYSQELIGNGERVPVIDPMHQVTAQFLSALDAGAVTKGKLLRSAHRNLLQLAAAWR